jgi:hypothetical protein
MKRALFAPAAVILAGTAIPQDLPPGVLLLSRVKNHVKGEMQRLPDISCLETVEREYQPARGKMRSLDTIRLEVLTDGKHELFASPGDRKFSEQHPMTYAGSGTLGDGIFGLYLKDILLGGSMSNEYKGEEEVGGRRLARYDYRLPLMWSGQTIQMPEGSGTVGLHGSYWADPETYDVVSLKLDAEDIPPTLPITEAVTRINYARTGVGNNLVLLLPQSADLRLVKFNGEINHNRIEFTHCRVFGAESTINFSATDSAEQAPRFAVASVDDTLRPLPGGLQISVKLISRISSDMSVGALIEGVVVGNVPAKGALVIAAGSPVRGRIRRLERYTDPMPHFVVALEFTEVALQQIRYRFYASLVDIESTPGVEQVLSTENSVETNPLMFGGRITRQSKESLFFFDLPGVATFFFRGSKLDLPQGFRTVWKTRPLKP